MRTPWKYVAAALTVAASLGCGSSTPTLGPADAAPEAGDDVTVTPDGSADGSADASADRADVPRADAPRADAGSCPVAPTPTGTSRAAAMCADKAACGADLQCDTDFRDGFCWAECTDNASQACEAAQCGGNGATCLSLGDGAGATSFCTATCNPTARAGMPGACRAGTVCTGWWYTHDTGDPDRTGCEYFCSSNSHCPAGMACNTRTGECGTAAAMTLRADGEPCDPTRDPDMGPSVQCRGYCFVETDNRREGICGSLINVAATPDCFDNPTVTHPIAPSDDNGRIDNLGLCIYHECSTDADCTLPLHCVAGENGEPNVCTYGDGIPAPDGGVRDASTDAAPADASTDAASTDAASTDAAPADAATDASADRAG